MKISLSQCNIFGKTIDQNSKIYQLAHDVKIAELEKELLSTTVVGVFVYRDPKMTSIDALPPAVKVLDVLDLIKICQDPANLNYFILFSADWFSLKGKMPKTEEELRRCSNKTFYSIAAETRSSLTALLELAKEA